jgi:hypothetical protein
VGDLEIAEAICKRKNSYYWQHRPGQAKSFDKVRTWLDWNRYRQRQEEHKVQGLNTSPGLMEEPHIDQWACDKFLAVVKNQLAELKNPKHPSGAMVWKRVYNAPNLCAIIMGDPEIHGGEVTYPCLVAGETITVSTSNLLKRRG